MEVATADRARLVAALGAVRAEMEAASVAVAGQRDAAAAASGAARRRIARLAAENEALMALSNALHAELGRRMPTPPTPPDLLRSAPAANQPPAGAAAEEMSARLGRIEAALAERPAGAITGAGAADTQNVPTLPQADKATLSRDATAEPRVDGADAGSALHPSCVAHLSSSALLVTGCGAPLAAPAPRRSAPSQARLSLCFYMV